ncbi:LamB/YcsF family protein [Actinomycetota bacterium]
MAIDLNADLGESFGMWSLGDDAAMLEVVTSANVACGFHAGDALTLEQTCASAAAKGVVIGAQVSYNDLAGFGRRFIDAHPDELRADIVYQIGALEGMCRMAGTRVSYVKPHGALYNAVVDHEPQAAAVASAVAAYDSTLPVLGLPGSALLRHAAALGLRTVTEAFADRGYRPDGTLVPRREPGAIVSDAAEVAERVLEIAETKRVRAIDGTEIEVDVETICLHGDTPGAVGLARAVRSRLTGAGLDLAPFVTADAGPRG